MSRLPDELADLNELIHLDISHNSFTTLPHAVYKMPKLVKLSANNNYIIDVEVERLQEAPSLQEVDLQNNPLSARTHTALEAVTSPHILVSVREVEDWEDLTV